MMLQMWFWVLMLLALVWGFARNHPTVVGYLWFGDIIVWLLFLVLGIAVFGGPLK